jgi:hypothetical protein
VHGHALTRLRLGFVALGVALLVPLWLLLREAESRLEAQRRLRHQIVAERVFDEMERELTLLLASERARPSAAYDASPSEEASWAPFVVGYFTRDAARTRVLGGAQLAVARAERVLRAVDGLSAPGQPAEPATDGEAAYEKDQPLAKGEGAAKVKQEAVLRQLNRATKERSQKPMPYSKSAPKGLGL